MSVMRPTRFRVYPLLVLAGVLATAVSPARAGTVFTPQDVLDTRRASSARISPDGESIVYSIRRTREATDKPGSDYRELHVASTRTGEDQPFITGEVAVYSPRWSPDGSRIAFLMTRGNEAKRQVWVIPANGGEAYPVTRSKTGVIGFRWHPDGDRLGFIATEPHSKKEEQLEKKGFGFTYFEENLYHRNLYIVPAAPESSPSEARRITHGITIWSFEFSPDGKTLAAGASKRNLIDYRYAFQKVYIIDAQSGEYTRLSDNPGKLGNFAFSPNGKMLAYTAARDQRDHAVSQVYVIHTAGGDARNLTPSGFRGHVNWVAWRDGKTVLYRAAEGVWNSLTTVRKDGTHRRTLLHSRNTGIVFEPPTFTRDFKHIAMLGSSANVPSDVYVWSPGKAMKRLTELNPWLRDRKLGKQTVIHYAARDGLEIEGILFYPVDYVEGRRYPLVVIVHGGPESRYANGWQVRYSRPTQVLAGRGYAVFLPNYRSSAGYGVDFTKDHLGDAAGKEFDDIADGIDHLVEIGLADRDRVGLGGGSYGGFAAAWFSSYYTKYVRAVCMFVGISDLVSKRSSTDIPYEELFVHSGEPLEKMWKLSLERSPIYWAHQSRSAVLIFGGEADTRVHPSQSLEYYRRLKMNDHPAVRLVRYPGEGHGNAKQPGKIDVLYRTLAWYDWYVKDARPLSPMPPLDISEHYGLDLEDGDSPDVSRGE